MNGAVLEPLQAVPWETPSVAWLVLVVLTGGLAGMSIRNMLEDIVGDGESEGGDDLGDGGALEGGDLGDGGGDGLMAQEGGDDLGGLGGLDDDGDDLGGFGDDEFGDMEGGDTGSVEELEHRLDELENEVGSLSSTVNTVRTENEQISESVEEVEENIRKLLDIYEMVTRGVNPFADDIDAGMGGMADGNSFGLFDDDGDDEQESIDDDIAEADAEGFFDDDLVDEDGSEAGADADVFGGDDADAVDFDGDDADAVDFDDSFEEEFDAGGEDLGGESRDSGGSDDTGGGKSFDELKDEYDSGDADWADRDGGDVADAESVEDDGSADDDLLDDDAIDDGFDHDLADDDLFDDVIEDEKTEANAGATDPAHEQELEPEPAPASEREPAADSGATAATDTDPDPVQTNDTGASEGTTEPSEQRPAAVDGEDEAGEGKPYLGTLPEGFAADLVIVEWLEFLVSEGGVRETASAIDYYETIDWIDEDVAGALQEYLRGFDGGESGTLTVDHHARSLNYIGQLNGDAVAASRLHAGGGTDGIQR